jgi:uncharacterized protein YdhG (YjbR/CyaY superfamily)
MHQAPMKKAMKQKRKPAVKTSAARRPSSAASADSAVIDDYIAACPPKVQAILRRVRALVREEAPEAQEKFSYRMPAFSQNGMLIYYAAFNHHLGIFPPVKGNAVLNTALAKYRGEKGNLRFPYDEPIPYPLIRRVVQARLKEHLDKVRG